MTKLFKINKYIKLNRRAFWNFFHQFHFRQSVQCHTIYRWLPLFFFFFLIPDSDRREIVTALGSSVVFDLNFRVLCPSNRIIALQKLHRYQLCFPVMMGLVLRLTGVKGGCCPVVNMGGRRKPQHPTCKLKAMGMHYLGRTPTSCSQKVSSCSAPRSYPNERQTPRSCQGVF